MIPIEPEDLPELEPHELTQQEIDNMRQYKETEEGYYNG